MSSTADSTTLFPDSDLAVLAAVADRDPDDLRRELQHRPWHLHDLLTEPETAASVLGGDDRPVVIVSPLLYFAVLVHRSAAELASASWVAEWAGPKSRLPVFDVETLQAFTQRPTRLLHLARVLTSFAMPTMTDLPVPVDVLDLDGLVDWLRAVEPGDQARLLERMGDIALFLAGVCADQTGNQLLSASDAERLGQSIGMTASDVLQLIDPGSLTPGLDALEELGARWYSAAAVQPTCTHPSLAFDLSRHIRPARRFLNHVADTYLHPLPADSTDELGRTEATGPSDFSGNAGCSSPSHPSDC